MSEIVVLDEALWESLQSDQQRLNRMLFLEPHETFPRQWAVNSFDATFRQRMKGAMSAYDSVTFVKFFSFLDKAEEEGYEVVFLDDPTPMLDWLEALREHPGVKINDGGIWDGALNRKGEPVITIDGFLPFQAVGVNFQKLCERMCWFQWSTGTGKTVGAEGTLLWRSQNGYGEDGKKGFDLCLIFAKPNNLVGTKRKLEAHTGLEATIVSGTPKQRERTFARIAAEMLDGGQPILILTYEKLREDKEFIKLLVEDHDLFVISDEAPTKLRTRGTQVYRSACEVFYTTYMVNEKRDNNGKVTKRTPIFYPKLGAERARKMFALVTSATPIYNSPQDAFSVVRMYDPTIFGSVKDFETTFVARKDRWGGIAAWKNLPLMGEKMAHVVYQVDKDDPDIASMFPEKLPAETVFIDLDPEDKKLYDKLVAEYEKMKDDELSMLSRSELLAAINCLQMLVNNPRGVLVSAKQREAYEAELTEYLASGPTPAEIIEFEKKNKRGSKVALKFRRLVNDDSKFTDRHKDGTIRCAKLSQLVEDVLKNDSKVITFSRFNDQNLPFIAEAFDDFGITYVLFRGGMSDKARQDAIDTFKRDESVKVFLSSDAGGDGIDLEEANLTVNYDSTWTDAAMVQRNNRQDRIISQHEVLRNRTYETPNSVEERTAEITATKRGYHNQVYKGSIAEQSADLRSFSKKGLIYTLTGREVDVDE